MKPGMNFTAIAMIAVLALPAARAGEDSFVGTWNLDVQQSQYRKDDLPREAQLRFETIAEGVHYTSRTTFQDGAVLTAEYTADYEGHLAMVYGTRGFLAPVSLKRIDAHTLQADYQRGLRTVASSRIVLSADAGTLTVTTTSMTREGKSNVHLGVYRRASLASTPTIHEAAATT